MRAEARVRLQEALNDMDPLDREVLALRHIEQLTNAEAARVLGIKEAAAGKRYLRGAGAVAGDPAPDAGRTGVLKGASGDVGHVESETVRGSSSS